MAETPDRWVILELSLPNVKAQKIFSGWYGGYGGSDSWRLSSQIVDAKEFDDRYEFHTESGNEYHCHKQAAGMSGYMSSIYNGWIAQQDDDVTIRVLETINVMDY